MTLEQAQALKVGDMVRWKDPNTREETLEVVIAPAEWTKRQLRSNPRAVAVALQTIAVMNSGDDPDDKANIGDEGWINEYNHGCFEKVA
jgi:hypothetical protein